MNTSSVNRLALEHFQELKEAWARESLQADHLRVLLDEAQQRMATLEASNMELTKTVETESLRMNLASHFIARPEDAEHTVQILSELLPTDLSSVSLLCCVKIAGNWIAIGQKSSVNHLRKFSFVVNSDDRSILDNQNDTSAQNNMELIPVGLIPRNLRDILQLGDTDGAMIRVFSHCFWLLTGPSIEIATSYLLERIGLLETATEIAMSAVAKHIQELEYKLDAQAQAVATKLTRFLYQEKNVSSSLINDSDNLNLASDDVKMKWLEIPRIIHPDFWNLNTMEKGVYRISLFRLFTRSSSPNWGSDLNVFSAPNGKLVRLSPGSAPAIAMERQVVVMCYDEDSYDASLLSDPLLDPAGMVRDGVLHLGLSSASEDAALAGAVIIPVMAHDESTSSSVLSRGCSGFIAIHKSPQGKAPSRPAVPSIAFSSPGTRSTSHITPDHVVYDNRVEFDTLSGISNHNNAAASLESKGLYFFDKEEVRKILKVLRPSINVLHEWMDGFEISDLDNNLGSLINLLSMESVDVQSASSSQVDFKTASSDDVLLEIDELYEIWDKFIDINTSRNHDSFPMSPNQVKGMGNDSTTVRHEPLSQVFAKKLRCHWCIIALIKEEESKGSAHANMSNLHVMDESGTVKSITGGDSRYVRDSYRVLERHNEFLGNVADYPEETRLAKLFHISLLNSQDGIDFQKTMGLHMFQDVDLTKSHLLQTLLSKGLAQTIRSADRSSDLLRCSLSVMVADAGVRSKDPTYPVVSAKLVVLGGRHLHGPHCWDRANGIRKLSSHMLLKMQSALRIRVMIHAIDIVLPSKEAELEEIERGKEIIRLEELGIKTLSLKLTKLIESCSEPGYTVVPGHLRCQFWHAIADTLPRALSSLSHVSMRRLKSEECLSFSFDICIDDMLSGRTWFLYPNRNGSWGKDPTIPVSKKGYRSIVLYQSRGLVVDGPPSLIVALRVYGIKGTSSDAASGAVQLSQSGVEVCERQNFASWVSTARLFFTTFESTFSSAHLSELLFSIPSPGSSDPPINPFGYVPSQSDTAKGGVILDPVTNAGRTDAIIDFVTSIAADCITVEPHVLMSKPDEANVASAWKDHSVAGASYLSSSMFWDRVLSEFVYSSPRGVGVPRALGASNFVLPLAMLSQGFNHPIQLFGLMESNGSNGDDSFGLSSDVSVLPTKIVHAIGDYLRPRKDEIESGNPANKNSDGVYFMSGDDAAAIRDMLRHRSGLLESQSAASSAGGSGMAILVRGPLPIHSAATGTMTELSVSPSDIFTTSYHAIVFISADFPISSIAINRLIETVRAAFFPLRFLKPIMSLQSICASLHDVISPSLSSELKALDGDQLVDADEFEAGRAFPYTQASQEYLRAIQRAVSICGSVCLSAIQHKPHGLSVNSAIYGASYVRTKQASLMRVTGESALGTHARSSGNPDDLPSSLATSDPVLISPMLSLFDDEDLATLDDTMDVVLNKSKFHVGLVEVPSKGAGVKSGLNNSARDFTKSTDIYLKVSFYVPLDRLRGIFSKLCLPPDYFGASKGISDHRVALGVVLIRIASDLDVTALFNRNKAEMPALMQIANSPTFAFAKRCIYSISQAINHFIDTTLTRANSLYDFSMFSQSLFDKTVDSFDRYITNSTKAMTDMLSRYTNKIYSSGSDADIAAIADDAAPKETFKISDVGVSKIVEQIVSHAESEFMELNTTMLGELKVVDEKYKAATSKLQANESQIETLRAELQQLKRRSADMDQYTRTFLKELVPRLLCGEVGRKQSKLVISGSSSSNTPMCYPPLHFEQMVCSLDEPLKWFATRKNDASSLPYAMSALLDMASFNKSLILSYTDALCELGSVEEMTSRLVFAYEDGCLRDNAESDFFPNEAAVVWTRGKDEYTITTPYANITRGIADMETSEVTSLVYCTSECICGEVSHPSMLQWTIASGQCVLVDNATGSATLMPVESRSADGSAGASQHNSASMHPGMGETTMMHQIPTLFPTKSTHKTIYIPIFIYSESAAEPMQASQSKRRMSMMATPIVSAGSTRELVAVVQYTDARSGLTERAATLKMCLEAQLYQTAKKLMSFADVKKSTSLEAVNQSLASDPASSRSPGAQFFFPLELLRLSLFTCGSPLVDASYLDPSAVNKTNDSTPLDWTALAAYTGAAAAGALRGSAALLLLSKNGAEVAGRIFRYRGEFGTVRQEDSLTVLKTDQLIEWCSRNKSHKSGDSDSNKVVTTTIHDLSMPRSDKPISKYEYLPTPSFGVPIFEGRAQNSGEASDESQSPLRYHVLLPIHLPQVAPSGDPKSNLFENIKHRKNETPLRLAGYLLVETTRRLDSRDIIHAASIAKLASFAASSKANILNLQRYMALLEDHATDMTVLQGELKRRDDFLVHYHRVHEFLRHSTSLVSDAPKEDGILADGEEVIRSLKRLVATELPQALGAQQVRLFQISSDSMDTIQGSLPVLDRSQIPLLSNYDDIIEKDEVSLGTSPMLSGRPFMSGGGGKRRNAVIAPNKYGSDDMKDAISYVLPASEKSRFNLSQACALAHILLKKSSFHGSRNRAENSSEGFQIDGSSTLFDSDKDPSLVMLHCRQGLVDASGGPLCIITSRSLDLFTAPEDAFGSQNRAAHSGDVWCLVLQFADINQWGKFVRTDEITDESYGVMNCATVAMYGVNVIVSAFEDSKWKSREQKQKLHFRELREFIGSGLDLVCKARSEGRVVSVPSYALATSIALSGIGLPTHAALGSGTNGTLSNDNSQPHFYPKQLKSGVPINGINRFSDNVREAFIAIEGESKELTSSFQNKILTCRFFWRQKIESRNKSSKASSASAAPTSAYDFCWYASTPSNASSGVEMEAVYKLLRDTDARTASLNAMLNPIDEDAIIGANAGADAKSYGPVKDSISHITEVSDVLQSLLNRLVAVNGSVEGSNTFLVKKIYTSAENLLGKPSSHSESHPIEDSQQHMIIAMYVPIVNSEAKELVHQGRPRTLVSGGDKSDNSTEDASQSEVFDLPPAVMELHLCIPITSSGYSLTSIEKNVSFTDYFQLSADEIDRDLLSCILYLREGLHMDYRTTVRDMVLRDLNRDVLNINNRSTSVLRAISNALGELYIDHGRLKSVMRQLESVLTTIAHVKRVQVRVFRALVANNEENVGNVSNQSIRPLSPNLELRNYILQQNHRDVSFTGSGIRYGSPTKIALTSPVGNTNRNDMYNAITTGKGPTVGEPGYLVLYESELSNTAEFSVRTLHSRVFDFACYEICGSISFEVDNLASFDEHEKSYAALAKAVGRRAYELYRGHKSKRQLVEEQKKNIKLEADIAHCNTEILRCKQQISELLVMRGSLEDSLKHAEVEMDKLKELLHSEQQALQAVMLEKKEQMKHSRRVMADVKSEHDRRERDLRKNIQDLSRGVHSSDKTYVALRNELDQAQSKIKALETKKADIMEQYQVYKIESEARIRSQEAMIASLQSEGLQLREEILFLQENARVLGSANDEKLQVLVTKLKAVEEEMASLKVANESLSLQLHNAASDAAAAQQEMARAREECEAKLARSKERLEAAERLIKQIYDHKKSIASAISPT